MVMRKFFTALVLIPLGLIFVVFAVANRHPVTVAGSSATWVRQRHWRRAARQHEADARQARSQLADLRAGAAASRGGPQRLPAPAQGDLYGATGRDKRGATL
jgi:hypothetical protein